MNPATPTTSAAQPVTGSQASSGRQEIRPGIILVWGETELGPAPAGSVACLVCQLTDREGQMSLQREVPPTGTGTDFRAAIFLTIEAVDELLAGDRSSGAEHLRQVIAVAEPGVVCALTARARLALESIRRCPFAGACRAMALNARSHDLLVEFLTACSEHLQAPSAGIGPGGRVRLAAEILQRHLENPPSLAALAVEVGLSETTLKRGFHRVFGTTVFGYVRQQRMAKARHLLELGAATVIEAATLVGYSNPSNFATAFRRQFGLNPKAFQLSNRHAG